MEFSIAKHLSSLPLSDSVSAAPVTTRAEESVSRLTTELARGSEEAFREFHERYFDRLYYFLLVVCRGREEEAGEALQQTMLRVARYVRRFSSEDAFWSWLKVVARSAARDAGRRQKRYAALLERFSLFRAGDASSDGDGSEPELSGLLKECLLEMSAEDRQLVQSKYFEGETVREIALKIEATEKAVENRLGRLRQQLRHRLLERLGKGE